MSAGLEVVELEVRYGLAQALNGVSLSIAAGHRLAVVGSNGADKTCLVRTISGMVQPASGRILFDDTEITGLSSAETCELGIGQVAEGRQIFPSMTVEENLLLGSALK